MRITFVTPFPSLAGGTRVIATYAQAMLARGHDVRVVSTPDRRLDLSWKTRVKIALGRMPRPRPRVLNPLIAALEDRHIWSASSARITADEVPDADVVIATWWETAEWVAQFPAAKGRKFYLLQDYEVFNATHSDRVGATYGLDLRKLAVSSYIREAVLAHPAATGEITVVPNAVDMAQFDAPVRGRTAGLTVGFLFSRAPRKNVGLAIEALTRARARYPDLRVLAFGRDPLDQQGALPDWVEYHFAPSQDDIPRLYAACDLWLFPTDHEGFGLPLLEAMACRTPVLATDAGAAPDLIDGTNGQILPRDPQAFAEAILQVRDMPPEAWQAWSDAAYRTAQDNTWARATDRLLAALGA